MKEKLTLAKTPVLKRAGRVELEAHLAFLNPQPTFVALTETLLNKATDDTKVQLTGYRLVSRRDRRDGRKGGGQPDPAPPFTWNEFAVRIESSGIPEAMTKVGMIISWSRI